MTQRHFRIVNQSELKEGISDDWRFCTLAFGKRKVPLAIAMGGPIAGALDIRQACILLGADVPLSIAGGLLDRRLSGEVSAPISWCLPALFIAFSAAAVIRPGEAQDRFFEGARTG